LQSVTERDEIKKGRWFDFHTAKTEGQTWKIVYRQGHKSPENGMSATAGWAREKSKKGRTDSLLFCSK
jgi:hypothetical protein